MSANAARLLAVVALSLAVGGQALPLVEAGIELQMNQPQGLQSFGLRPLLNVHGLFLHYVGGEDPLSDGNTGDGGDVPPGEGAHVEVTTVTNDEGDVVLWVGHGALRSSGTVLSDVGDEEAGTVEALLLLGGALLVVVGLGAGVFAAVRGPTRARGPLWIASLSLLLGASVIVVTAWTALDEHVVGPGIGLALTFGAVVLYASLALHGTTESSREPPADRHAPSTLILAITALTAASLALGPWISDPGTGTVHAGADGDGLLVAGLMGLAAVLSVVLRPGPVRSLWVGSFAALALVLLTSDLGRVWRLDGVLLEMEWGLWSATGLCVGLLLEAGLLDPRWGWESKPTTFAPVGAGPTPASLDHGVEQDGVGSTREATFELVRGDR